MAPEHHAIQLGGADDLRTFVVRIEVPRPLAGWQGWSAQGSAAEVRRPAGLTSLRVCATVRASSTPFLCSHPVFSEDASKIYFVGQWRD
jgi:hypothetical protein